MSDDKAKELLKKLRSGKATPQEQASAADELERLAAESTASTPGDDPDKPAAPAKPKQP